mgnify:CR=1 FL=1
MKKLLALLLTLVMCLSLAACGGSGTDTSGTDTSSGETGEDSGDSSYRVAMICDSSISDGGWGMSCYNAMVDAAAERGWATEVSDSIAQSAYYDTIISYCDLGYDLIYAPGNQYTDAVLQAAEEFPDVAFALLNGGEDTPAKAVNGNVTSLLPNAQQVGWIAGALAGLMTKSGTVAFIGAMELDTTLGKYNGFKEAAAYVGQQEGKTVSTLDVVYSGDFSAADKGIEFAKAMIDQGADVFFGDASAVDSGARQAIDEANAASGSVSIYDIAQPSDLLGQNECIIGSQVTDNASLVGLCMEAVEDGSFGGEVIYGTLQNGALSAGALSDLVPADVQEKYQGYLDQMVDGSFMQLDLYPQTTAAPSRCLDGAAFPPARETSAQRPADAKRPCDQKSHGRFSDILPHRNGAVRPVLRVIRSGKLSPPGSLPVFSCGFYRYSMWVHIPLWPDCPTWPSPPGPRGQTAQETALESIARSEG